MAETAVKLCTCDNRFQDKKYGPKKRLHNANLKGDKHTCTVCGTER